MSAPGPGCSLASLSAWSWNLDPFLGSICVGILAVLGAAPPHTRVHLEAGSAQPCPGWPEQFTQETWSASGTAGSPCRAQLVYPQKHIVCPGLLDICIPVNICLFLLIPEYNFPVGRKKPGYFSEVKMLVSIMLPTTHKDCFLGAWEKPWVGDSWAEILYFSI